MENELASFPTTTTAVIIDSDAIISINEEVIAQKIENLFVKGLDVCDKLLDSNIATLQLPIARSILSAATKLIGQDKSNATVEMRKVLDAFWKDQRETNAQTDPALAAADNPEEES